MYHEFQTRYDRKEHHFFPLKWLTSNLSWSASVRRPRGSQKPKGGCAPIASSKFIRRATQEEEEEAAFLAGAKAVAERVKERAMRKRNMGR